MTMTRITSHQQEAIERLANQFKDKPRIEGFIRAFIRGFEAMEEELFRIRDFRWVDTAHGKQLDGLGAIVGQKRNGRNDVEYRIAILAKIAINTSEGLMEDLIAVFRLLTGATDVNAYEYYPGVVEIYGNINFAHTYEFLGPDSFAFEGGTDGLGFGDFFDPSIGGVFASIILHNIASLKALLDRVLAGGVRLDQFGWYSIGAFGFEGNPDVLGFGDALDATVGGEFASIISA